MKYRELRERLNRATVEQLNADVTVYSTDTQQLYRAGCDILDADDPDDYLLENLGPNNIMIWFPLEDGFDN